MNAESRYERWATALLVLFYGVGLAGHLLPSTRALMLQLTPWVLLLLGLAAVLPFFLRASPGAWLWSAAVLLATFLLEAAGTATGRIFGPYTYGPTLGWKLLQVPVVIAFNWLLVILGFTQLARRLLSAPLPAGLLAAALTAGFDFLMEPVAVRLGYWSWQASGIPSGILSGIPPQNYLAWFLIALAASLAFTLPRLAAPGRLPGNYVLIQAAFFAGLRIGG